MSKYLYLYKYIAVKDQEVGPRRAVSQIPRQVAPLCASVITLRILQFS